MTPKNIILLAFIAVEIAVAYGIGMPQHVCVITLMLVECAQNNRPFHRKCWFSWAEHQWTWRHGWSKFLCHFVINLYSFSWEIMPTLTTFNSIGVQNIPINWNIWINKLSAFNYQMTKNTYAVSEQNSTKDANNTYTAAKNCTFWILFYFVE